MENIDEKAGSVERVSELPDSGKPSPLSVIGRAFWDKIPWRIRRILVWVFKVSALRVAALLIGLGVTLIFGVIRPDWAEQVIQVSVQLGVGPKATPTHAPELASVLSATPPPTVTPIPTATPLPTPTPLPFEPEGENEVLIVIASFYTSENVGDFHVHGEMKSAIEEAADESGLAAIRVEVHQQAKIDPNTHDARDTAEKLGNQFDASMVIWGGDTGVRTTVSYLNLRQPDIPLAYTQLTDVEHAYLRNPVAYSEFVTEDLPGRVVFLSFYALAQSQYANGEFAIASSVLDRAIDELSSQELVDLPDDPSEGFLAEAYLLRSKLYSAQGDRENAIEAVGEAIDYKPNIDAYIERAWLYIESELFEEAINDLDQALEIANTFGLEPAKMDKTDIYVVRGLLYQAEGEYQKAVENFNAALELEPNSARILVYRGKNYRAQSKDEDASNDYNKALKLERELADPDPDILGPAYLGLAWIHLSDGEYEEARKLATSAIEEREWSEIWEAYLVRAMVYRYYEDYNNMIRDLSDALEDAPDHALAPIYWFRIEAYAARSKCAEANKEIKQYAEATNVTPEELSLPPSYSTNCID